MKDYISVIELEDISITGIDLDDYPDFCDAYIYSARWKLTGLELTEDELQRIDPNEDYELIALKAIGA
jgi:hypothetical protein